MIETQERVVGLAWRMLGSRPGTMRGQIASARMKMRSLCVDVLKNGKGGLP